MATKLNRNGTVIYQGPSMLDGRDIVAIATGLTKDSDNSKTGDEIQTYILLADESPVAAIHNGNDASICGDCPLRGTVENGRNKGRACYVIVFQGPLSVYNCYRNPKSGYPVCTDLAATFSGRRIRLGTYGDPAAVPLEVWQAMLAKADGHTGYTHQWRRFPEFASITMASVETHQQMVHAKAIGFRTFRVTAAGLSTKEARKANLQPREIACGASAEMGHKTTCHQCLACGGTASKAKVDVAIEAHGMIAKQRAFKAAIAA